MVMNEVMNKQEEQERFELLEKLRTIVDEMGLIPFVESYGSLLLEQNRIDEAMVFDELATRLRQLEAEEEAARAASGSLFRESAKGAAVH